MAYLSVTPSSRKKGSGTALTLYQNRRITLEHGRVLRRYGERGVLPDPRRHARDWRIWSEAMQRLGGLLQQRGWIAAALPTSPIESPALDNLSAEARLLTQLQALCP